MTVIAHEVNLAHTIIIRSTVYGPAVLAGKPFLAFRTFLFVQTRGSPPKFVFQMLVVRVMTGATNELVYYYVA